MIVVEHVVLDLIFPGHRTKKRYAVAALQQSRLPPMERPVGIVAIYAGVAS